MDRDLARHYGDAVAHRFVVGADEHGACGIALVCEQTALGFLRPPTIVLGTAGEPPGSSVFVERNRLLARPADRARFAAALLSELERDRRWQRLRLDGMLPADADALLDGRRGVRRRIEQSPLAQLDQRHADARRAAAEADEADGILTMLSSSTRRRVRQSLQHLGPLQTEWAQSESAARSIFEELISLHQARWNSEGMPGAFASTHFTAFHRDLIARLLPLDRVALFRVRHEQRTLACLYGLIEGERLLFYQSGVMRSQDNRLRPGLVAHVLFMQACRERGLRIYDFLAPSARYKRELASGCEQLVWAELEHAGLRMRIERAARATKKRLRRRASSGGAGA